MSGKSTSFTIGQLAKKAKVNIQTVRFYERQGILKPDTRMDSGYRLYTEESLRKLVFIRQAKQLGFSLSEIKDLLALRIKSPETRQRVRTKAESKLKEVQSKISSLKILERTLNSLISDCQRGVSQCCPILDRMEK